MSLHRKVERDKIESSRMETFIIMKKFIKMSNNLKFNLKISIIDLGIFHNE